MVSHPGFVSHRAAAAFLAMALRFEALSESLLALLPANPLSRRPDGFGSFSSPMAMAKT